MSWATQFPEELLRKPNGLVCFAGLDIKNNAVHKSIWDAFLEKKSEHSCLQFKLQDRMHEFPPSKPKKPSYDWYIPKGLLKSSWMKKHLDIIPSLVIFFMECDWEDPQWKNKLTDCGNAIKFIRNQLSGRGTKVGLVLIQKSISLPPGEDIMASERASQMCVVCDLPNKLIFVLPISESLHHYIVRLEQAFEDFSRAYYNAESRKVKTHKDYLNKTTHGLLFVRHQFKIAFYNELKQESITALKHYSQAYTHLLELRMLPFNLLEIKTIAGFINYKICKLNFMHNKPHDAISQFRTHVDFFKTKLSIPDLNFEHPAWMSKQFHMFGDLFDEAIKQGLTAILIQHPGIYYQQAAHHATNRRTLSETTCREVDGILNESFVNTLQTLDYYGQRPWRQGQQSIEAPDVKQEKEGIKMMQLLEKQINHSALIIPLLCNAVTHAKRYKSPRLKRHLLFQLMNEYFLSKEYSKALVMVTRATHEYRNERWWMVLTSILSVALKCALLSADIQQYITLTLELGSIFSLLNINEKMNLLENLSLVLQGNAPSHGIQMDTDTLVSWIEVLKSSLKINVDVTNIIPFVDVKVQFGKDVFQSDELIELKIYLRSLTVVDWSFDKLSITFNNQSYNKYCVYEFKDEEIMSNVSDESKQGMLTIQPDEIKCVTFTFTPSSADVGSSIEVTSIVLETSKKSIEGTSNRLALTWSGARITHALPSINCQSRLLNVTPSQRKQQEVWQAIKLEAVTKLSSRKPLVSLKVEHNEPAFVHEMVAYNVIIHNCEEHNITNLRYNVILDPNILPAIRNATTLYVAAAGKKKIEDEKPAEEDASEEEGVLDATTELNDEAAKHLKNTTPIYPEQFNTITEKSSSSRSTLYKINDSFLSPDDKTASDTQPSVEITELKAPSFINSAPSMSEQSIATNDNEDLKATNSIMTELSFELPVNENVSSTFYSCTKQPGNLYLLVSATYDVVTGKDRGQTVSKCVESNLINIKVIEPVELKIFLLNLKMDKLPVDVNKPTMVDHNFLLTTFIRNLSKKTIYIAGTKIHKNVGVIIDDNENRASCLTDEGLQEGETASETFYVSSNAMQNQELCIGEYSVSLIRNYGERSKNQVFTKSITLPRVMISASPLYVDLILPSFGVVHANLFIYYSIKNMTHIVQELTISMDSCEGFMFSGHKQVTVRVLPLSNIQLKYNLVPLVPGNLQLPRLNILNQQFPDFQLENHRQTPLPTSVFIKPQSKVLV